MSVPIFKTLPSIVQDLVNYVIANSELTDINPLSVTRTILEAVGIEDAEQYLQQQNVLDSFSFESAEGTDLDRRVDDFDLERLPAAKATGNIVVTDTSITKQATQFDGAHPAGSGTVTVDDTTGFPGGGGTLILSREDPALRETVTYAALTATTFTGVSAWSNNHPDDNTVILSQQGSDTPVVLGTIVFVPATANTVRIDYETTAAGTILDGDENSGNIPDQALKVGSNGKVVADKITEFDTLPFSTATVTNPLAMAEGRDRETDIELASRVKLFIASLSNATKKAIEFNSIGITDSVQGEVVSASAIDDPSIPGVVDLFIDNGAGLVASTTDVVDEVIVADGEVGQLRARLGFFPVVDATLRLFKSLDDGDATSVGTNTLTDTSKSFTVNEHTGRQLVDGTGTFFEIASNTATVITVSSGDPSLGHYGIIEDRTTTPLVEDTDYTFNRTVAEFQLTVALADGELLVAMEDGVSDPGYTYFTGLIRAVQRVISGDTTDLENFPGVAAAGIQVFVQPPAAIINQSFQINIETIQGVSVNSLISDVQTTVVNYVNSLGVGEDIILSEIVARVHVLTGIFDVQITLPTGNVVIGFNQLARTSLGLVTVF